MIYFGARLLHRDLEEGEALLDEERLIKFKTLIKRITPPPQNKYDYKGTVARDGYFLKV
jgi:hypothetical protein